MTPAEPEPTASPRSRREARLASTPAVDATTDAPLEATPKPVVAETPAAPSTSRRARRASSETISAPADVVASSGATDAPSAAARATAATVSRRAARAAAAAAAAADGSAETTPEIPQRDASVPDAVAASSVATLRPHAQKAGRRAAESFSDEIEKPAGGRRAIVSSPTTALPSDASPSAASSEASAAPPTAEVPVDIEVEVVVAVPMDDPTAPLTSAGTRATPVIETAAIPVIETAAAILPAAMAGEEAVSAKPLSRRTLRTAAIVTDTAAAAVSNDPAHASGTAPAGGKNAGTGTGAGRADDAKPPTGRRRRNIAKGGFSALALLFATGIAVATTMPAEALHAASEGTHPSAVVTERAAAPALPGQELTTSAEAAGASIARDGYSVRDVAALKAAGFRVADTFTNNPTGAIQWPFPVGVPISDGFGARESPGGIGSTDHKGVDFAPGQGTPIQSIADGVVSSVQPYDNSGLGVHVIIDHVVDGQKVSSVYGHMLTGSIEVTEGQVVKVAQTVGLVGNTGASTGPHLHLEIRIDGVTPVDPFAWLQTHAV